MGNPSLGIAARYQVINATYHKVVTAGDYLIPIDQNQSLDSPALTLRGEYPFRLASPFTFDAGLELGVAKGAYQSLLGTGYLKANLHYPHNKFSTSVRLGYGAFSTKYSGPKEDWHHGFEGALQTTLLLSSRISVPLFFGAQLAWDGSSQVNAGAALQVKLGKTEEPLIDNTDAGIMVLRDTQQRFADFIERANRAIESYGQLKEIDIDGQLMIAEEQYGKWFLGGTGVEPWDGMGGYLREKYTISIGLLYAESTLKGNPATADDLAQLRTNFDDLEFYIGYPLLRLLVEHEYSAFHRIQAMGKAIKAFIVKNDPDAAQKMFNDYKNMMDRLYTVVHKLKAKMPRGNQYLASAQIARVDCWSKSIQCSGDVDVSLSLASLQREINNLTVVAAQKLAATPPEPVQLAQPATPTTAKAKGAKK